ncbi:hypothetical protein J6TS7_37580 [Paenibacillus dendritiformis]|nr:hypothetical protein J6TS7_37580 [Paenibacillus dendritiformis]
MSLAEEGQGDHQLPFSNNHWDSEFNLFAVGLNVLLVMLNRDDDLTFILCNMNGFIFDGIGDADRNDAQ